MLNKNLKKNWVAKITLKKPSISDNTADVDRLINALKAHFNTKLFEVDFSLTKQIPFLLRKYNYKVKCICFKKNKTFILIAILVYNDNSPACGLAIDLGSTKIAINLIDFETKSIINELIFANPQAKISSDILDRIHYADNKDNLNELNLLIINKINENIKKICQNTQKVITPSNIYIISIAGNTAMTHFLLGLTPYWMIREPYIPVINKPETLKASKLGIKINSNGHVYIFPNIGSYFGGDLIAGILKTGLNIKSKPSMLIDIGTNAEVVLGDKNWLIGCAGAAGPALEGGISDIGTTAKPGVIDKIKIDPKTLEFSYQTIDNFPPIGICGSGLIDLAAQLFLAKMIDIRGKFVKEKCKDRLFKKNDIDYLCIIPKDKTSIDVDISISQIELDNLVRSKAAMYTILETISLSVGLKFSEIETIYIAGAFGSVINPKSAIAIGMIPDWPDNKFEIMGNTSLDGASLIFQSINYLDQVNIIADKITYLELNVNQDFMNRFSAAKFIPHTNADLFQSIKKNIQI